MKTTEIRTETIRLGDFLKLSGAVETGGEAKAAVQSGAVLVNGQLCLQRGRKLRADDTVSFRGREYQVRAREDGPKASEPGFAPGDQVRARGDGRSDAG